MVVFELFKMMGGEVVCCDDGCVVFEVCVEWLFDFIFFDCIMFEFDGFEVVC